MVTDNHSGDRNMKIFKDNELPSCITCEHANLYIPYYTFPYSDPYCIKGHGQCNVNKLCGDYKMTTAICGKCKFIKVKDRDTGFICVRRNIPVSFSGKTCEDYIVRDRRVRE